MKKWRQIFVPLLLLAMLLGCGTVGQESTSGGAPDQLGNPAVEGEVIDGSKEGLPEPGEDVREEGGSEESESTNEEGMSEESESTNEEGMSKEAEGTDQEGEPEEPGSTDEEGVPEESEDTEQEIGPETEATRGDGRAESSGETEGSEESGEAQLAEDGVYSSKEDVALYLYLYGHLPSNYITKKEAEKLGWPGGSLEPYAPGMCIGGNRFGNYEGLLPEKDGRTYTECDIDTLGAVSRGAKRIVFSNDGLIYYTEDHYQSFELLYGEE